MNWATVLKELKAARAELAAANDAAEYREAEKRLHDVMIEQGALYMRELQRSIPRVQRDYINDKIHLTLGE